MMRVVGGSLLAIACTSSQRPAAQSAPAPAPAPVVQTPSPAAESSKTPDAAALAPELERLARSVHALDDTAPDAEHRRLIRALRNASAALEELEVDRAEGPDRLRAAAERIDASDDESVSPAGELRAALVAARDCLRAYEPGVAPASAFDAALEDLARNMEALGADRPLLEQQSAVRGSFRALANAMFLATGHDAPFTGGAPDPRSAAEVLDDARTDVLALGRADLSNVRERTARAMYSMAELVEAVDARGAESARSSRSAEIRAQARRLEHDASGPFARAGWVERGLDAALAVLNGLDLCRETLVASSADAARRAARGLPERGALPFQHAAIQDAFRATLDAFGMALLDREACQTPARRSPGGPLSANSPKG